MSILSSLFRSRDKPQNSLNGESLKTDFQLFTSRKTKRLKDREK